MNHAQANVHELQKPEDTRSVLDQIVREGAQKMLQRAIEAEGVAYIEAHQELRDDKGHRLVVRNGHQAEGRF